MEICRYSVKRRRDNIIYQFCKKNRCEVVSGCYRGCPLFERRGYKPINKVSKKKVTVSKETYIEVAKRCQNRCVICGATQNLSLHHIYFRSERKDLIDNPDNCVLLCNDFSQNNCHRNKAHKDKKYWQPILLEIVENQKKRGI